MTEATQQQNAQQRKSSLPPPAPVEYAGQWVAWNRDRTKIIAHGEDVAQVYRDALASGHASAIYQKIGRPGIAIIGMT